MKNSSILKKGNRYKILIHIFFALFCLLFVLPMVMVISVSFSSEEAITNPFGGYSLLPRDFTLDAYRMAFRNPKTVVNGYVITTISAFFGTFLNVLSGSMCAYSLARPRFRYKKIVTFIVFFTMLFGGGTIPTYIVYTKYYHLGNTIWIYLLPALAGGAWNILMMRTFMQSLPESMFESAKIDGASEMKILLKIGIPLSKPVLATVAFGTLVGRWNDWNTSLVYIRDPELYTLQYSLQKILRDAEFLKNIAKNPLITGNLDISQIMEQPTETLKYSMCVIAAGPMLVIFPFFQKYFEKGMVVGSVKG